MGSRLVSAPAKPLQRIPTSSRGCFIRMLTKDSRSSGLKPSKQWQKPCFRVRVAVQVRLIASTRAWTQQVHQAQEHCNTLSLGLRLVYRSSKLGHSITWCPSCSRKLIMCNPLARQLEAGLDGSSNPHHSQHSPNDTVPPCSRRVSAMATGSMTFSSLVHVACSRCSYMLICSRPKSICSLSQQGVLLPSQGLGSVRPLPQLHLAASMAYLWFLSYPFLDA